MVIRTLNEILTHSVLFEVHRLWLAVDGFFQIIVLQFFCVGVLDAVHII